MIIYYNTKSRTKEKGGHTKMKNSKTVAGVHTHTHTHTHTRNLKEIKNINKIEKIEVPSLCQIGIG